LWLDKRKMVRGTWIVDLYSFFIFTPPHKGDFRGYEKKKFKNKSRGGVAFVAFCCIPMVLAVFEKRRRGESLVLASVRLAFSSFYAI
jgi:hypothetical protein